MKQKAVSLLSTYDATVTTQRLNPSPLNNLVGVVKWPFQRLSDLQLGDKKVTLNHLVYTVIQCAEKLCFPIIVGLPIITSHERNAFNFPRQPTRQPKRTLLRILTPQNWLFWGPYPSYTSSFTLPLEGLMILGEICFRPRFGFAGTMGFFRFGLPLLLREKRKSRAMTMAMQVQMM